MSRYQAIKGMPDILPKDTPLWHTFESHWRELMRSYCYDEIRFPLVENTSLFKRSIGEVTDIVEKEMFTFTDKDGESITLRPEGTAGCVRAGIENGLLYNQTQRLWYMGPMFRYEKPQKGRYRQFHQVGVESFGFPGPDIEVEHILMTQRLWRRLGIDKAIKLEINSIGGEDSRKAYRKALVDYFSRCEALLDEDSKRRLKTNPMRILDSKNPALADVLKGAPKSFDFLLGEDLIHFNNFKDLLKKLALDFVENPRLVRGLDYYNRTVYEWTTSELGAQNAVCAGGRYDSLIEQLGGSPTFGVGFAIGIERIILLMQKLAIGSMEYATEAYLIAVGEAAESRVMTIAERIRDQLPALKLLVNAGGGSFKNQFKRADKSGASIALILGEEELAAGTLGVKFLREAREQEKVPIEKIGAFLNQYLKSCCLENSEY